MSDVTLVVGGKEYPAHRLILCISSEVFQVSFIQRRTGHKSYCAIAKWVPLSEAPVKKGGGVLRGKIDPLHITKSHSYRLFGRFWGYPLQTPSGVVPSFLFAQWAFSYQPDPVFTQLYMVLMVIHHFGSSTLAYFIFSE